MTVDLAQNTLDGLMVGSSYALLAVGFTLIFGVMRRLNLAYGPTIMAGVYLGSAAFISLGAPLLAIVAIVVIVGALGFYLGMPQSSADQAMRLPVDPAPLVAETAAGERSFTIEIADDTSERSAGLMFRELSLIHI